MWSDFNREDDDDCGSKAADNMPGCRMRQATMSPEGKHECEGGRATENVIDIPSSASLSSPG